MSLITKTPEHVVPAYNLPRGRAVDRGKVAEVAEAAEAPQAAQAPEGRMVCREFKGPNAPAVTREAEEDGGQ